MNISVLDTHFLTVKRCFLKNVEISKLCQMDTFGVYEQVMNVIEYKGGIFLTKVRIAIADDNRDFVRTMEQYFENHPNIEIVATAQMENYVLKMLEEYQPDVLTVRYYYATFRWISCFRSDV